MNEEKTSFIVGTLYAKEDFSASCSWYVTRAPPIMSNSDNGALRQESFNGTGLMVFNGILSSNVSYNGTTVAPLSNSEIVTLILIGILGTIGK